MWTRLPAIVGFLIVWALSSATLARADESPRDWEVRLSPYLWMASLEGDVATLRSLPTVEVDAGFDDIFDATDLAFMLQAEARYRRVGLMVDLAYLELSAEEGTPGPAFGGADLESDTLFVTLAPFFRLLEDERLTVDAFAGVRIWRIETRLRLTPGVLPGVSTQDDETWADPLLGARGNLRVWGPVSLSAAFDVGGFDAASELTWQMLGTVDWQPWRFLTFRAGYRHLEVDYEDGGFEWDVAQSGPILGATFRY